MSEERLVGGLRCGEVLQRLGDYLDDELSAEERARVEAHLRACGLCERFGGEMAELVTILRRRLGAEEPADAQGRRWAERFLRSVRAADRDR